MDMRPGLSVHDAPKACHGARHRSRGALACRALCRSVGAEPAPDCWEARDALAFTRRRRTHTVKLQRPHRSPVSARHRTERERGTQRGAPFASPYDIFLRKQKHMAVGHCPLPARKPRRYVTATGSVAALARIYVIMILTVCTHRYTGHTRVSSPRVSDAIQYALGRAPRPPAAGGGPGHPAPATAP
jgi:hypothetical protein